MRKGLIWRIMSLIWRIMVLATGGFFILVAGMAASEKDEFWLTALEVGILCQLPSLFPFNQLQFRVGIWLVGVILLFISGFFFPMAFSISLFGLFCQATGAYPPSAEKIQTLFKLFKEER